MSVEGVHPDWLRGPIPVAKLPPIPAAMLPPFRPEAPDPAALARFSARARERWGLSDRQAEVAYLLCAGHTSAREIARASGMAEQTVKNHKKVLFARLGLRDMTQVVMATWGEFRRAQGAPATREAA